MYTMRIIIIVINGDYHAKMNIVQSSHSSIRSHLEGSNSVIAQINLFMKSELQSPPYCDHKATSESLYI